MLSGIRTRKRKKHKSKANDIISDHDHASLSTSKESPNICGLEKNDKKILKDDRIGDGNFAAADTIRQMLARGPVSTPEASLSAASSRAQCTLDMCSDDQSKKSSVDELLIEKIDTASVTAGLMIDEAFDYKPMHETASTTRASSTETCFSSGVLQNGKSQHVNRKIKEVLNGDENLTIKELVAQEKRQNQNFVSMDEQFSRNVYRLGKQYKGMEDKREHGATAGADEVDFTGTIGGVNMNLYRTKAQRTSSADLAKECKKKSFDDKLATITQRCWWWIESSMFKRHMLLSLGNQVSLVLAPENVSLAKGHCYIVPIKHTESIVSCEEEVFSEVLRFQSSLRAMHSAEGKGVLFVETVMPNNVFWQTKIEAIPISKNIQNDAPMYFKSAFDEQAEDFGTHTKVIHTKGKGLRRSIPKKFPYIHVEWDDGGFAQIIESSAFNKDFALDTIAGMMGRNSLRFDRKRTVPDDGRSSVLAFCARYKKYDWTYELDNETKSYA